MSDDEGPRNRRERRAAAKADGKPLKKKVKEPKSVADIPMAHPDYSGPKAKTLYEIADERMAALKSQGQPFNLKQSDGSVKDEEGHDVTDEEVVGPLGEAIFLTITLSMVHFTLDVLVYQQYAMDIIWPAIFKRTASMVPVLLVLIYLCRTKTAKSFDIGRQMFFLAVAIAAGCYMIYVGNTYDYFAVMKQAPPLGTLWIFSVIEMRLVFALTSIIVDVGFLWWKGYTVF